MEKYKRLLALFVQYKINGYIIPSNDEYMSEYIPPSAKRLEYMTGFTGSNGIAIIYENSIDYTKINALFFTDGRYIEQSKQELNNEIFKIFNLNDLPFFPFASYISNNAVLGYDPKLFTSSRLNIFSNLKSPLCKIANNLIDKIWDKRPQKPSSKVYIHHLNFAGQSYIDKVTLCRKTLDQYLANMMIITAPDSICWLLNLRANDVPYTPLMLSLLLLTHTHIYLFIDPDRVDQEVCKNRPDITILPETELQNMLLTNGGTKILVDDNFASIFIMDLLDNKERYSFNRQNRSIIKEKEQEQHKVTYILHRRVNSILSYKKANILQQEAIQRIDDPCQLLKACKNDIEVQHAINFHIKDGIALCEFFAHMFTIDNLTEYDLAVKLTEFRSKQKGYIMDSFPTICGFKENSAIIHYHANKEDASTISNNGILLIDSGAQYLGSTTDVTRTFIVGEPTEEQKKRYTQVLKGHIALSLIKFPVNITGSNLDVLARQFLWRDQLDYPHGTGHGVGSFLKVHEGPQNISLRNNIILQPGMILSNEPGYYKIEEFGIRIENLMYIKRSDNNPNYLQFETLTLVPYANELINYEMLTIDEVNYIKQYYENIQNKICPLLSKKAKTWVEKQFL